MSVGFGISVDWKFVPLNYLLSWVLHCLLIKWSYLLEEPRVKVLLLLFKVDHIPKRIKLSQTLINYYCSIGVALDLMGTWRCQGSYTLLIGR